MARTTICKKDGTPTRFFWVDTDGSEPVRKTVYKQTEEGIKKMRGVSFNVRTNEIQKD
jgi:hypothetical protein